MCLLFPPPAQKLDVMARALEAIVDPEAACATWKPPSGSWWLCEVTMADPGCLVLVSLTSSCEKPVCECVLVKLLSCGVFNLPNFFMVKIIGLPVNSEVHKRKH